METEDKLNMMSAAGFEVTHEPCGKELRVAKIWAGHELVDRLEYPEAAYASVMDLLFNFYLIGRFGAEGRSKNTAGSALDQLAKQQEAAKMAMYNQMKQNNQYANQAQGLMNGYPPEQLGQPIGGVAPVQYEAQSYAQALKISNTTT